MSAYNSGTTYANEDWLISPAINLNKTTTLTFEQVFGPAGGSFDNATSLYTLWTSTDYTNDVKAANWSKVDISYPGASGWNPWQKVEITLPLLTENARIAFKYKNAATDNTLTWEIKNLTIK